MSAMEDPGLNQYDWETEFEALEDDLKSDPEATLPELDRLVARMLEETGYDLRDPVAVAGDEREIVAEYLAAHETADSVDRGDDDVSPGDVADAINALREVYDSLVAERSSADADFEV
jgi:hypothetical protein